MQQAKSQQVRDIRSKDEFIALINERNISHISKSAFDLDGVMVGKYMKVDKFLSALDSDFAFVAWCLVGMWQISCMMG